MKLVLLSLFAVIEIASANMVKNDITDSQIREIYSVPDYTQVYLPSQVLQGPKSKLIQLVREGVSKDTPFLFRTTYVGWKHDNSGNADFTESISNINFIR